MLSLEGLLMNCFMGNEFVDTKTGVITPATLKVQMLCDVPQKSGDSKKELITMTVKEVALNDIYKSLVNSFIRVPVGVMANGKALSYWILPNTRPEKFAPKAS